MLIKSITNKLIVKAINLKMHRRCLNRVGVTLHMFILTLIMTKTLTSCEKKRRREKGITLAKLTPSQATIVRKKSNMKYFNYTLTAQKNLITFFLLTNFYSNLLLIILIGSCVE